MKRENVKLEKGIKSMLKVMEWFPVSGNGQKYVRTKDGRKVFFFLRKYGLDGTPSKYSRLDVMRRIRLIEFFPYFIKKFDIKPSEDTKKLIIESAFYRMILLHTGKKGRKRLELLSFYHHL